MEEKEELLKRLEGSLKDGRPVGRPGHTRHRMVDFDDLVVVPSRAMAQGSKEIGTEVSIGIDRYTQHPIHLEVPIYIADMSYGELGRTAKAGLALGSALAGSMVLCGHGVLLPEEKEVTDENGGRLVAKWSKGRFGDDMANLSFGHGVCIDMSMDPGILVPPEISTKEVADVYGIPRGALADTPISHLDLQGEDDLKLHVDLLREALDYKVPVMVKFSGGEVYEKVRAAIEAGAEAVVLEGMQAWRARSDDVHAEHAGEPLLGMLPPAVRAFVDTKAKAKGVKLLVQGGINGGADVFKALAMGADAVGLDCAALVGVGCRMTGVCNTNKCPQGVATVDPRLESKVSVKESGEHLYNLITAFTDEIVHLAGYAGLAHISAATMKNLRALTYDAAAITGVRLVGYDRLLPHWVH
jgi:glutamate synthase domain-containing protein 2